MVISEPLPNSAEKTGGWALSTLDTSGLRISHTFSLRHFQLVHAGCSEARVEPMCPGDSCGSTSMALKVGGGPRLPEGAIGPMDLGKPWIVNRRYMLPSGKLT